MTSGEFLRLALGWTFVVCLAYVIAIYMFYLFFAAISARASRALNAESEGEDYGALADSAFSIPVSILAPVFNEEVVVVGAVKSLLTLAYPEFEVVLVNDGSTDRTLELLKREFELEPRMVSSQRSIPTERVRATYRSRIDPRLLVIDKVNGRGKADPLNCGLNYARYRYLCCIDGDTFYSPDALLRAMRLVVKDPGRVVGVTSMISVSRHPEAEPFQRGRKAGVDTSPIIVFQQLEYARSFLSNRLAWSWFNFMLCASGCFSVWRRDIVAALGGFSRQFTCEDIEISFRIHEHYLKQGMPYRILALSDTIARTEAPSNASALIRQRARWQRVIMETVWHYRRMLANPRYRSVGLIGMPYYVLAEALAPAFQTLAIVALGLIAVLGLMNLATVLLLFAIMALMIGILSLAALLIQDLSFRQVTLPALVRLTWLAPFDFFLYRPLIFFGQLKGALQFLGGRKDWDKFERNVRPARLERSAGISPRDGYGLVPFGLRRCVKPDGSLSAANAKRSAALAGAAWVADLSRPSSRRNLNYSLPILVSHSEGRSAKMKAPDWKALRKEFPTLEHWTYLDVARKTVPPRCQAQALQEYTRDVYENAGADAWAATNVAETRILMARLLGARPSEIAFTKNTTEGLNIAAHAFDLKPGDNVVLTNLEHTANVWVWKHWESRGVEIRYAQHRDGRLPLEAFLEKIDGRTRVVSTAYVTYGNGYRVNLPELGAACRSRGIRLVVDGVQAAGILAAPLNALNADVVAIGGHKGLFGLTGSGIVYCREELVDEIKTPFVKAPAAAGTPAAQAHAVSQFDYMRTAHRFEGGNPNFLGVRVLRAGAEFLESVGIAHIESRVRELTTFCLGRLKAARLETQTPQPWEERAQIVNVLVPDAATLMERLRATHRIVVNVKDGALRLSMSFFNTEEDIDKAVRAIETEIRSRTAAAA